MIRKINKNIVYFFVFGLIQLVLGTEVVFAQNKLISSKVTFKIENAGLTVNGSFSGLSTNINFNPEKYATAKIEGTLPVATIKTGNSIRDNHLQKKEYFDAVAYPEIQMVSKFFGKSGNDYKGYFLLTMKGITKDVVIPFTAVNKDENLVLTANFELNRQDFKVGGNSLILDDKVFIIIVLEIAP